jgi:hypothetical protein
MDFAALMAALRVRLDDKVEPFLWADQDLKDYLNEACREAVERSLLILDRTTTAICAIAIDPDTRVYELDPRVIDVHKAWLDRRPYCYLRRIADAYPTALNSGLAEFYSVVQEGGRKFLTLDRVPSAEDPATTLLLEVYRYPLAPMVDDDDVPELPEARHRDMLHWAVYLAYDNRDPDAGDVSKAQTAATRFTEAFGEKIDANVHRKQLRHQPTVSRPIPF